MDGVEGRCCCFSVVPSCGRFDLQGPGRRVGHLGSHAGSALAAPGRLPTLWGSATLGAAQHGWLSSPSRGPTKGVPRHFCP